MPYTDKQYCDVVVKECFLSERGGTPVFDYSATGPDGDINGVQWLGGSGDKNGVTPQQKAFSFFKAHGLTDEQLNGADWQSNIENHMIGRTINVMVTVSDQYGAQIKYFNEPGRGGNRPRVEGKANPFTAATEAPAIPWDDVPY